VAHHAARRFNQFELDEDSRFLTTVMIRRWRLRRSTIAKSRASAQILCTHRL
jgi:hypothetical protein